MDKRGFEVLVDPKHGGRWTSLTDPTGREWLWSRPDVARFEVLPGSAFVDVGGYEECFPTIGGRPDHGDVWSRPWKGVGDHLAVESDSCRLSRRLTAGSSGVIADYRLQGKAGYRFIWAGHALLEPTLGTRVVAPEGHQVLAWRPGHIRPIETTWPEVLGIPFYDILGPDDASAMFCVLPKLEEVTVIAPDGSNLRFRIECAEQPVSFGIWRNLAGYPADGTGSYRSFGIEPMLGRVSELSGAKFLDVAIIPASGEVTWRVVIDQVLNNKSIKT